MDACEAHRGQNRGKEHGQTSKGDIAAEVHQRLYECLGTLESLEDFSEVDMPNSVLAFRTRLQYSSSFRSLDLLLCEEFGRVRGVGQEEEYGYCEDDSGDSLYDEEKSPIRNRCMAGCNTKGKSSCVMCQFVLPKTRSDR